MRRETAHAIQGIIVLLLASHLAGCTILHWWHPVVQGRTDMLEISFDIAGVKVVVSRMGLRDDGFRDPLLGVTVTNTTGQDVEIDFRSAKLIFARDSALIAKPGSSYLFDFGKGIRRINEADLRPDTLFPAPEDFYFDSDEPVFMKEKGVYLLPSSTVTDIYFSIRYSVPIILADSSISWRHMEKDHRVSHRASLHDIMLRRSDSLYRVPAVVYQRVE